MMALLAVEVLSRQSLSPNDWNDQLRFWAEVPSEKLPSLLTVRKSPVTDVSEGVRPSKVKSIPLSKSVTLLVSGVVFVRVRVNVSPAEVKSAVAETT